MTNTSHVELQPHRLILLLLLLLAILGTSVAFAQTVIRQKDVPVVITQPGSYVLGSNLIVSNPNVTAILVNADNVTIDLAGFAIIGPSMGPTGKGMGISGGSHTTVRNGTIRGFWDPAGSCINLGWDSKAEDLRVLDCPSGIFVSSGIVNGCQVSNSGDGIGTYGGSLVTNNTVYNINGPAVHLVKFLLLGGTTVIGNNFHDNSYGILVNPNSAGNRIEGNTLTNNYYGIWFQGSGNFFARNLLQGNATPIVDAGGNIDGGTIDAALTNVVIP